MQMGVEGATKLGNKTCLMELTKPTDKNMEESKRVNSSWEKWNTDRDHLENTGKSSK